ncbi:hypothetical protein KCU87_g65, partial [Aureobasidium melanogenum]
MVRGLEARQRCGSCRSCGFDPGSLYSVLGQGSKNTVGLWAQQALSRFAIVMKQIRKLQCSSPTASCWLYVQGRSGTPPRVAS